MAAQVIVDLDLAVVRDVLERARALLPPEDHACIEGAVQTLVKLSALVRERGTTIARLRRLFGLFYSDSERDCFVKLAGLPTAPNRTLPLERREGVDTSGQQVGGGAVLRSSSADRQPSSGSNLPRRRWPSNTVSTTMPSPTTR
jgi:hypothetical protein